MGKNFQVLNGKLQGSFADFKEITYFANTDNLQGAEIIELQISAMDQIDPKTVKLIQNADFFVWCSNATQAWRNSEQEIIKSLKLSGRQKRILVLTRGDHLNKTTDATKLLNRVESDDVFQATFGDVVLVKSSSSSQVWKNDATAWRDTGVFKLSKIFSAKPSVDGKLPESVLKEHDAQDVMPTAVPEPEAKEETKAKPTAKKKPAAKAPAKKAPPAKSKPAKAASKKTAPKKAPAKTAKAKPAKPTFSVNADSLVERPGFKSFVAFALDDSKPLQEVIKNDLNIDFASVAKLAKLFHPFNDDHNAEMNVTLAEKKVWTLIKYSSSFPGAVCVMRISRAEGNLATIQKSWNALTFDVSLA